MRYCDDSGTVTGTTDIHIDGPQVSEVVDISVVDDPKSVSRAVLRPKIVTG